MSYNAKPWLRRVARAAVAGMADGEVETRGFGVMLAAMRAAYYARHPEMAARAEAAGLMRGPQDVVTDGDGQLVQTIRHAGRAPVVGAGEVRCDRAPAAMTDGFAGGLTDGSQGNRPSRKGPK